MDDDACLPPTATQVKVTNVIDPYHFRIYEIDGYAARLAQVDRKLHQLAKTKLLGYEDDSPPQIGDLVLIDNGSRFNVDLPAWCCRGVVGYGKSVDSKHRVFLPDHGIALDFWVEDLKILPPNSISNDYLTLSVGIGDILPVTVVNSVTHISEGWSKGAVQFMREMVSAAKRLYFDHLNSDKSGNKFGELYLILDGEIVPMSKALACNKFGTILTPKLLEMIENPDTLALQAEEKMSNGHNNSTGEYGHEKSREDKKNSDKSEDDKGQGRSTAVYPRAFDGSLKKKFLADSNNEIQIYSKFRCGQLDLVTEARFTAQIHEKLRSLSIVRPMRIQGYVWPAITEGHNVVAIASRKCGKTISYLVPVVSSIAANEAYPEIPGVNGPLALILCGSSSEVYEVTEKCTELLQNYRKVTILAAYNGISELSVVSRIYNGCEILISTPPYLTRLIKKDRKLLNFSRLSHMIFDGADVILDKYRDSLGEILKIPNAVRKGRPESPRKMPLQMIAIARHWTPSLKKLIESLIENPYICIGSYMEAAIYAGFKPKLIFLPKSQKAAKVLELLEGRWTMTKTVIVCTTKEEATELAEILKSNSIHVLFVHDGTIFTEIKGVKEIWMTRVSGRHFVLVCTDQVISDLNIKDAEWLIHYSLGSRTKTEFYYRFSMLSNNFSPGVSRKERPKPRFTLMADESNDAQVSGIVDVMLRLDAKIPAPLKAYLENIMKSVEMAKTDRRLCDSVKAFGRCPVRDSCASRHVFVPEIDQPTTRIRTGDWVKMILTGRHKHSANHYSARVLEYTTASTNERIPFSFQEFVELSVKMQKHYANPANRRSSKTVNIGQVCAFEESPGIYKRLQVLSSVDKDSVTIQYINVRSIDEGDSFSVKACQLLEIPDDLAQWPSHIVDIYLTGIIPFDNEPTWSPCTEEIVRKWFDENLAHPTSYVYGKVLLHLSHILWVDPLEVRHKLPDGYPDLVDSSLKATLIKAKCAMENKEHITDLLNLLGYSNVD